MNTIFIFVSLIYSNTEIIQLALLGNFEINSNKKLNKSKPFVSHQPKQTSQHRTKIVEMSH
jgi:hypothetical protein